MNTAVHTPTAEETSKPVVEPTLIPDNPIVTPTQTTIIIVPPASTEITTTAIENKLPITVNTNLLPTDIPTTTAPIPIVPTNIIKAISSPTTLTPAATNNIIANGTTNGIVSQPSTPTSSSQPNGFANCASCSEKGVKAAFYGKNKLFCSSACLANAKQLVSKTNSIETNILSSSSGNSSPAHTVSFTAATPVLPTTTASTNINEITTTTLITPSDPTVSAPTTTSITTPTDTTTTNTSTAMEIDPTVSVAAGVKRTHLTMTQETATQPITPVIKSQPVNGLTNNLKSTLSISSAASSTSSQVSQSPTIASSGPLSLSPANSNALFSWTNYIENKRAEAAPVHAFRHVPFNKFWRKIIHELIVEVPCKEATAPSLPPGSNIYWFATVIGYAGYFAKMRFFGYDEKDDAADFWMHMCDPSIHNVGWSAEMGKPLAPPSVLVGRVSCWKKYLLDNMPGFKTLPKNFHKKINDSLESKFKKGMLLELVDKYKLSRMRVARIITNTGGRLHLKYENCEKYEDFWCHERSDLIHPIGWSSVIGHDIDTTEEVKKSSALKYTNKKIYETIECSPDLFKKTRELSKDLGLAPFKPQMKIEAIDPLNLAAICVASVSKVLKNNYLMIRIDGCPGEEGSDMFCYHRTSPCIFPAGFCQKNNIPLTAPYDYKGTFSWDKYLKETNSQFAPAEIFSIDDSIQNPFKVGMKLESVDLMEPEKICVATVVSVVNRLIRLTFDGWQAEFDQWVDFESCDIYPVGWCQLVKYKLEPPRQSDVFQHENARKKKKSKRRK